MNNFDDGQNNKLKSGLKNVYKDSDSNILEAKKSKKETLKKLKAVIHMFNKYYLGTVKYLQFTNLRQKNCWKMMATIKQNF